MELRHLRYFVAVAETLNFSRAAGQLHVTQPALSRQIRDLEQELGCLLLRRGANARTELTPEGRRLLSGARPILAATETLTAEVKAQATQLRFGHYGALWLNYFTPALRRFAKKHPQIMLQPADLTPGTLPGALRRGEIDLALLGLADAAVRREFQTRQVGALPARLALAAGHPLAKRRRLRLAELREATWVSWDEKEFPGRKQLLVDACRRAGFRPRIAFETDSIASLFVRVATSDAIGQVLPMSRQLPHEGVVFAELDPPNAMSFEMFVAWRRNEPRDALIDALVAELAATAGRQA